MGGVEAAVAELRLVLRRYEGVELHPRSRIARELDAARRALAAYDAVHASSAPPGTSAVASLPDSA
jgi:hypothetical protein